MLKSSYCNGGAMVELVNVNASSCPLLGARLCSPEHHPPHPRAELRACTRAGGASSHPGCRAVSPPSLRSWGWRCLGTAGPCTPVAAHRASPLPWGAGTPTRGRSAPRPPHAPALAGAGQTAGLTPRSLSEKRDCFSKINIK